MPTDTRTSELVLNMLSKQQYDNIPNPDPNQLYLVPDEDSREHRSYYTQGTAVIDGETVDADIMYEGVAPEGSLETDAVWTITTIVATLDGNVLSNDVNTDQTWDYPTPTPVVPVIGTRPPICYPTTASEVKTTSMLVKSSVDGNGRMLTENGFVYNTSGNPTISDTKVICDFGIGFFEKKLENLTMNTEYHIKSYGQNASGLVYGSELVQRTMNNPIPIEYQLVKYLESSNTQYINTGYVPNINDIIVFNVAFLGYSGLQAEFYGAQSTNPTKRLMFAVNNQGACIIYYSDSLSYQFSLDCIMHEYKYTSSDIFLDNTIVASNLCVYPNLSIYLFARNQNGSVERYTKSRCYNFSVLDSNNQYIRRMYPVYRITDNKPGMYDIVNGVFYTNQGTGEFIVGPDKEWDDN